MPYLGNVYCTFVRGQPTAPNQRVQVWQVPGIDGYGAQLMGLGDSPFDVEAIGIDTYSNVYAWSRNVQALRGQLIVIVNDWATSYPYCLVLKTSEPKFSRFGSGAKGIINVSGVVIQ